MKITIVLEVPEGTTVSLGEYVPPFSPDIPIAKEALPLPGDGVDVNQPAVFRGAANVPITSGPPQVWAVGQVHQAGHQPLKAGAKGGLFCPSKVGQSPDGRAIWCPFRA